MRKKLFLSCIILILVISLVPLSGVSAQRPVPASSASMSGASEPAARAFSTKTVKTQYVYYCGGLKCFKYTQVGTWEYDGSTIGETLLTNKGVVYRTPWDYGGSIVISTVNYGPYYYYALTEGVFLNPKKGVLISLHIEQRFFRDGSWWANKFYIKDKVI